MKNNRLALVPAFVLATSAILALPTQAQTAEAPAVAASALFQTFGAKPGLVKLMDDFMVRLLADPRTGADFNALVEVLQAAMDAQGIPYAAQNRLLALLAPMHRDVITVQ